jgi:hypothetical protein
MPKLSYEGLVGTLIALIVVILDQAGVKNPYVLWIAFALAIGLCLDATIRSGWPTRRKAWGSGIIVVSFGLFAAYLVYQLHPEKKTASVEAPAASGPPSAPAPKQDDDTQPKIKSIPNAKPPKKPSVILTNPIPTPGSINQNNSGGVSVQQGTTGSNSPIVNSPINIQASIDAGRRLKTEDREILVANLMGLKANVAFGSILAVPDAYLYASDLRDAFNAAGLGAKGDMIQPMMFGSGSWTGIEVTWHGEATTGPVDVLNSSDQGRILAALSAAHLGPLSIHVGPEQPEGVIKIVVGLKPPS